MSTILISLLRHVDAFEHLRAAVCAADEYHRELSARPADEAPKKATRASRPARSGESKPRARKPKAVVEAPQAETPETASQ